MQKSLPQPEKAKLENVKILHLFVCNKNGQKKLLKLTKIHQLHTKLLTKHGKKGKIIISITVFNWKEIYKNIKEKRL